MSTALVVGADRGIARAIAIALADRGDNVFAACLGDKPDLSKPGITVIGGVDVTSDAAVARMASDLTARKVRIDALYHVAGILLMDELGSINFNDVRRQFEVNAIGPLRTVQAVAHLLDTGSKVGIVTSRVASLGDNHTGGTYGYRMSKAAANMAGLNLHHDLSKRGIAVLLLHPGMVATDLVPNYPHGPDHIKPEKAAEGLIKRMDELTLESAGVFRHANGELLPW